MKQDLRSRGAIFADFPGDRAKILTLVSMDHQLKLSNYKQEIADLYTGRSQTYDKTCDNNDWHWKIANRLVEYGQVVVIPIYIYGRKPFDT